MKTILIAILGLFFYSCGHSGVAIPATGGSASHDAIQRGIAKTVAKAKCRGYNKPLDGLDVDLKTGADVTQDSHGIPAIKQPCGAYCGSGWDMGGYILASGYYSENDDALVLPYIPGRESYLELAAEYEAEHAILFRNDKMEYARTSVHLNGQGHPLLADCPNPTAGPTPTPATQNK